MTYLIGSSIMYYYIISSSVIRVIFKSLKMLLLYVYHKRCYFKCAKHIQILFSKILTLRQTAIILFKAIQQMHLRKHIKYEKYM